MGKLYVIHNEWIKKPKTGEMPYKIGITKNTVKERYYGLDLKMPGDFECDFAYEFDRKNGNKLNIVRIKNKFDAKLECNVFHPYNKRIDLEFICRNSSEFPEIKNFIKELDGSRINGHIFKVDRHFNKIYHIFDYEDPSILETFLELYNFTLSKMKDCQFF